MKYVGPTPTAPTDLAIKATVDTATGDVPHVLWNSSTDWGRFDTVDWTWGQSSPTPGDTVNRTVELPPSTGRMGGRGVVTAASVVTSAQAGDSRRASVFNDLDPMTDSEITSTWWSPGAPAQQGHVHRLVNEGNPTTQQAVVVWQNIFSGVDSSMLTAVWRGTDNNFNAGIGQIGTTFGDNEMRPPPVVANVYLSRSSGTVTIPFGLGFPHGLETGDKIRVRTLSPIDTGWNVDTVTVTRTSPHHITWPQTGTGSYDGSVIITKRNDWPRRVKTRLVGRRVIGKVWHPNLPEPPWGEKNNTWQVDLPAAELPIVPGRSGLQVGHLTTSSGPVFRGVQFGPVAVKRLG